MAVRVAAALLVVAVSTLVGAAVVSGAGAKAMAGCQLEWRAVHPVGRGIELTDVAAFAPTDVWAVGGPIVKPGRILVEHWNGRRWLASRLPIRGVVTGLAGTSSRDIWAVGSTPDGQRPLVVHYDGRGWSAVSTPALAGRIGGLQDVVAIARDDVWAVGGTSVPRSEGRGSALILHWDGRAWATVQTPTGAAPLSGVAARSTRDVWAVGATEPEGGPATVIRWDGEGWRAVDTKIVGVDLAGVAAVSATDVWAAGSDFGDPGASIAHWDGKTFRVVRRTGAGLQDDTDILSGVATSGRQVWVMGAGWAEHWNGRRWRGVKMHAQLVAADALSPTNIWAVGGSARGGAVYHYACR